MLKNAQKRDKKFLSSCLRKQVYLQRISIRKIKKKPDIIHKEFNQTWDYFVMAAQVLNDTKKALTKQNKRLLRL